MIPTPTLIERVSSAKQLFWTTLKSNFKTRLRYTLKHLGSMHDPLSHGNWSKGAGMYGGKAGLAGKVRRRLGDDMDGGGGGGGGGGKRTGPYAVTSKRALKQFEAISKQASKATAVRDYMLGRPETAGLTKARGLFEEINRRAEQTLKGKELTDFQAAVKNARDNMTLNRNRDAAKLFQSTAEKYASGGKKIPATLKRDAADAVGQDRDSQRGNTFISALNKHEGKEGVNRVLSAQTGQRTAVRAAISTEQRLAQAQTAARRMNASIKDPTARAALTNVSDTMISRIRARATANGKPISRDEAKIIYYESIAQSGWQPRLTTPGMRTDGGLIRTAGGVTNTGAAGGS